MSSSPLAAPISPDSRNDSGFKYAVIQRKKPRAYGYFSLPRNRGEGFPGLDLYSGWN